MSRMTAVLLLGCLVAGACGPTSPTASPAPFERQFVLAPGQAMPVPEAAVSVRFVGVTGDSRCPGDALCIQGGDAVVRVDVEPARGARASYDLHTGDMRPARHGDITLEIVELAPYPFSSLPPTRPGDYRLTLRVRR